ncbi:MAG: NADH-quinone oxidoreductase subunit M [Ignavibacteria bacterium]|nr:NADH-quinone oxidoreductase subunit M [Ignavibacteria bacterium]MBI3766652.1 NADH-quinone oxidoreductase subunit M [Ignavibacteriales bacterium]
MSNILTYVIFLPLVGSALLLFAGGEWKTAIKTAGLAISLLTFFLSLFLYFGFDPTKSDMQFTHKVMWIPAFNVSYNVGIDGLSLLLALLTTFLTPIAMLSSWASIEKRVKEYTIMLLLLETGMLGVFCSLDMFLFYIFWEAMLIPMYFIIGIWGGQNRIYAAIKFFLYTMFGSLLMLVAIIWLGYYASTQPNGRFTTDLLQLYAIGPSVPLAIQTWMFLAFALSFAIKVPLFPFHTWLPDAHVEAPTAGSVILAGVLLKMGTYGLLRFCIPLFPQATVIFLPYISALAVIGIIYGALVSMVQTDIKKLVAYSSVSHLGFVVLGIFALTEEGIQGAIIQMVNHGLSTGALFLIVGMLYDRRHTRMIDEFGGLAKVMPLFATFFMIVSLSSIGLPGLNGFVGEFLILLGAFHSVMMSHWFAIFAATGVILAAVYLLWMYQRVIFGKITNPVNQGLADLSPREIAVLVPVLVFIVWIGVYPGTFLKQSASTTQHIVSTVRSEVKPSLPFAHRVELTQPAR